jgi:hypothetical protein
LPIPRVDPVTMATFPSRSNRLMGGLPLNSCLICAHPVAPLA